MTTGASLKPDSASSIPASRRGSGTRRSTEKTAAASVEGEHGAEQQRQRPVQAEQEVGAEAPTTTTETAVPTVASTRGRGDRRPDRRPAGGQPALGQDQHQGGVAEDCGELGVVELDAEAALAEHQAEPEVEQQRGQAGADGQPDGARPRASRTSGAGEQRRG